MPLPTSHQHRPTLGHLAALLIVSALSLGTGLGRATLWEPDEPRFAEATRQMFERSDFLTPYFNGVPRFEKPILFYWLQAAAFQVVGPGELAARLPAALSGIGIVLLLYLLTLRVASPRAAVVAALVMATMFRFVAFGRQGLTDVPVLFFIVLAIYGFVCATSPSPSRYAAWLAWTAVGLGVLTKGPIGLLSIPIWLAYAAVSRDRRLVTEVHPLGGLVLAAAIAVPWYLVMIVEHGRPFVDFALGHEIVERALSERAFAPTRGVFYYVKVWPGDAAPWSVVFVAAAAWLTIRWRHHSLDERTAIRLSLTWFATVFVVFSLSRSKVPHYVLPAYPAAALLIGVFVDRAADATSARWWWRVPMAIIAVAVAVAAAVLFRSIDVLMPDLAPAITRLLPALLTAGALAIAFYLWNGRFFSATIALALTLAGTFAFIGGVVIPAGVEGLKPMPRLSQAIRQLALPPGRPIGLLGEYGASSLIYYAHRNVVRLSSDASVEAFLAQEPPALCVMPATDFDRIKPQLGSHVRVIDSAEEFNVRLERLLERQRAPGRQWVLISSSDEAAPSH